MQLADGSKIEFIEKPEWRADWCCAIKIIESDGKQWGITFDRDSYREFISHFMMLDRKIKNKLLNDR